MREEFGGDADLLVLPLWLVPWWIHVLSELASEILVESSIVHLLFVRACRTRLQRKASFAGVFP